MCRTESTRLCELIGRDWPQATRGRVHTPKIPRWRDEIETNLWLHFARSAFAVRCLIASPSFALRLPQLALCSVDFVLRLLAKKNPAELIPLIISGGEFFLRVRSMKIHTRRRQCEIAYEVHSQIEHFRPKVRYLFVTDALLPRHVCPCYQTLLAGIFPVRLTPHAAHD